MNRNDDLIRSFDRMNRKPKNTGFMVIYLIAITAGVFFGAYLPQIAEFVTR